MRVTGMMRMESRKVRLVGRAAGRSSGRKRRSWEGHGLGRRGERAVCGLPLLWMGVLASRESEGGEETERRRGRLGG